MSSESFSKRKESAMGRPQKVQQARFDGNVSKLSAMGRKGAEATNELMAKKRLIAEAYEQHDTERREADAANRVLSANEHVISPDGEDLTPPTFSDDDSNESLTYRH